MHHTTATYAPPTFATGPLAGGETGRVGTAVRCLVALAGVMVFGTVGFLVIEPDWDLWQSLYFTLITITTVGYGDDGLSPTGEKFASLLLLAGIGTATYSVSVLVQLAVGCQLAWRRNMQQHIDRLSDHIVVCGFGRIGKTICEQLSAAGVPFVVLEHDESAYQFALELGYPAAHGDATEDDMLRKVGVGRCRGVVCVTDSDAENTFITLSVRDLNGDAFVACRADNEGAVAKVQRAGASLVVSPHHSAGVDIATAILRPSLAKFLRCGRGGDDHFQLTEMTVDDDSPMVGQTIGQFGRLVEQVVFVAIERPGGETLVRPPGGTTFRPGDVVIVAGSPDDLSRMHQEACAC